MKLFLVGLVAVALAWGCFVARRSMTMKTESASRELRESESQLIRAIDLKGRVLYGSDGKRLPLVFQRAPRERIILQHSLDGGKKFSDIVEVECPVNFYHCSTANYRVGDVVYRAVTR